MFGCCGLINKTAGAFVGPGGGGGGGGVGGCTLTMPW